MQLNIHDNLDAPALDRPPIADSIGPFVSREFLAATSRVTGGETEVVESSRGVLLIERTGPIARLAGDGDLTDYHSPLGADISELVAAWAGTMQPGTRLDFDSLPAEAADPIEQGLRDAGVDVVRSQHHLTAVLDLPATFDDYLGALTKKQRHEVRRKVRRFTEALGTPRLVRETGSDVVHTFADLHRRSSGPKGSFMTEQMEEHFHILEKEAGAFIQVLYAEQDRPVAATFAFEDADTTYLYNSAYEPDFAQESPGIVLVAKAIEDSIQRGRIRFDFLKGDEIYKFRMGAHERPLYRLEGTTP